MYKFFDALKQRKPLALICVIAIAAALCIILMIALRNPAQDGTNGLQSSDSAGLAQDTESADNDLFATALSTGEYESTVLGKTDDAGIDYVKETLFIGDSNTAGMINMGNTTNVTMNNGIGIVSMGVSHVTALKCVKFGGMAAMTIPDAIKIMQPRRIVITYGTNDYYMTPEDFAKAYEKALDAIETAYPYSDIVIGSIFPITSNCSYYTVSMPVIEKFNLELVNLAQERGLKFLNWSEALKDPATGYCKPEYMAGDGVHLSKAGMVQIFDYFRTHELESEDRRPKPLKSIPAREATPAGLLGSGPRTPVSEPKPAEATEPDMNQSLVNVYFVASHGGQTTNLASFQVAPGTTVGPVAAGSYEGFTFVGWSGGSGSGSFTVPADATPGQSFTITAMFEATAPSDTTDPGTSDPGGSDPGATDPDTTDPGEPDPDTTDPPPGGSADPGGSTSPGATNPDTTDPSGSDPGATGPGTTDSGGTDPGVTDPGTTDPGGTGQPSGTEPLHAGSSHLSS